MGKRSGLFVTWFLLLAFVILFYYLLHNTNHPLLFYSIAGMVMLLSLACFLLLLLRYKFNWKTIVYTPLIGLLLIFIVRHSLDQRIHFALQSTLSRELPGVVLSIKEISAGHAGWAKPVDLPGHDADETRSEGHFFPSLPHYQSEAILADHPAPDEIDTVSYRFVVKQPYFIDGKDISAKYCFVWGACSYFYKGYADVNVQTGEVIGLKIVYRDLK